MKPNTLDEMLTLENRVRAAYYVSPDTQLPCSCETCSALRNQFVITPAGEVEAVSNPLDGGKP